MNVAGKSAFSMDVTGLSVHVIGTVVELYALEDEWRDLVREAALTLPFRTFEWNVAWWNAFSEDRLSMRDDLAVRVLRDAETGKLIAIAPLALTTRPARGPFQARILQAFGADPNITEIRGLVCAECDEARVIRALWAHLLERAREWDWIVWSGLRSGSDAARQVRAQGAVMWAAETPSYVLELPATFGEFRAGLPHNVKESLRRCYNSLRRDGHTFELVVLRTWEHIEPALEVFRSLHAARAARTDTVQHQDVFCSAAARTFLRDACRRLAQRDALRVFALRIGGRTVAIRIGIATGDSLYLYYSGYDVQWARYSVMTTCTAEAIRWTIEAGYRSVNLSTGRDESKTRWRPAETVHVDMLQLAPWRRAAVIHRLHEVGRKGFSARPLQNMARRLLRRQGRLSSGNGSLPTIRIGETCTVEPGLEAAGSTVEPGLEAAGSIVTRTDVSAIDVSVVTPTLHRETEVVDAIKSALAQSGVSLEIIVLDDSPDGSARIAVEGISDARVRYLVRQVPSGGRPAIVRNEGAGLARGRYVCFLDDDDQLLPGCLRAMVATLEGSGHVGVAVARVVSFGSNPQILRSNEAWADRAARTAARTSGSRWLATAALLFGESFTSACVIRRAHIEDLGGYDASIPLYEDVEFYTRAIRKFGHVFVDCPMLYRRTGEPSLTNDLKGNNAPIADTYKIMYQKYKHEHGLFEYSMLRVLARILPLLPFRRAI
jgi:CelD/BcsL family acetyltransferase involved in cellulose biosynthesis/glycosyltransferase involved in cell wall biosynthesis